MSVDPLELPATPQRVRSAARGAKLPERTTKRALEIVTASPDRDAWHHFLTRTFALLGAGLVLAGVVCFVAYNWARVGRFGKFGVIELAIVAATLVGWRKLPRLSGQIALTCAAVLVGPLFAVYGQTYQTGADPYGLFLTWFVVIIPWVVAARFSALWVIALALLDLALTLFWFQVIGTRSLSQMLLLPLTLGVLHAVVLYCWEWQFRRVPPVLDEEWAPRLVAATGLLALWTGAVASVVGFREASLPGMVCLIGLAGAIAAIYRYYRTVRADRFMVTVAIGTGMALVTVAAGRVIFDALDLEVLGFFLMTGFVIGQITLGLGWFRGSRRRTGDT
jgi:uncharacterized membrane protein